jgi:hypothetical protein
LVSQSALLTMTASVAVAEGQELREHLANAREVGRDLFSVSSFRASSLPDGSPTRVVPPPISAIGLWPVFCIQRSIMIGKPT